MMPSSFPSFTRATWWLALPIAFLAGCDCGGTPPAASCSTAADCSAGERCIDQRCVPAPETDASTPSDATVDARAPEDAGPCGVGCRRCRYGTCVPDLGECTTNDECPGDSYCDTDLGECLPYGVPPEVTHDPNCQRRDVLDEVRPVRQCEWAGPGPGDIEPRSSWVYTAPMIADLNFDEDPGRLQPSIVVTTWYDSPDTPTEWNDRIGMLRIFDGRTCEEQLHFGGPDDLDNRPAYGTQWAIADLDGDVGTPNGRPELIGLHRIDGRGTTRVSLYAIKLDVEDGRPVARRMWYGRNCATDTVVTFNSSTAGYGPSVHDLNDDGVPEVLVNQMVFDAQGCLLNAASTTALTQIAAADVDGDGRVELVRGNALLEWDPTANEWIPEPYYVVNASQQIAGSVAIADLGAYSVLPDQPLPNQLPEIIVVGNGTIRVHALDGSVVFGPIPLTPVAGATTDAGGPPTASDFDGDGQVELAAAAKNYYMVFDPDCLTPGEERPERPGGRCDRAPDMASMPPGVLWARPSAETSSGVTGSSIFDFDGNGTAEAVYRDECFLRVYEGGSGRVLFSAPASSLTGWEMPTIADVDGDFATEIVVPRTPRSASICGTTDPLFPGSGSFVSQSGFIVYRDPEDRWASSRPIWNQYAYSITNVTDDGRIPRTSEWRRNWVTPGLNNFRQNAQGETGLLNIADLTVVFHDVTALCTATLPAEIPLEARVCNRGTNPVSDGVLLEFVEGETVLCSTRTSRFLVPGECEELSCSGIVTSAEELFVRVDPDDEIADCRPDNDQGVAASRLCLE